MIEQLIEKIDKGQNLLLTGPAGTGKSTIIKALKDHYNRKLVVTSTTGISALNIGGGTIHSFSGIGINTKPESIHAIMNSMVWNKVQKRVRYCDIVVIDEISMLREDQLNLISEVFKEATRNSAPFGGKTMIFVGDFLQLPPVVKGQEKINWIFNSKVWKEANIEPVHLFKIHRQTDETFLSHLIHLRFGWCFENSDAFFKSRTFTEKEIDPNTLRFFSTNMEAENFNTKKLYEIDSEMKTHYAQVSGISDYYEKQIKQSTLAQETLELKVGARVMFLNNYKPEGSDDYLWVNGSLGTVVEYRRKTPIVVLDESGETVEVKSHTWELKDWEGKELASFTQIPLKLAYGVTIHKSQGLTLDKAVIDCKKIFADGQAYVALSRVRSSEGLYLLNWNNNLVKADPEAVEFYLKSMKEG